MAKRKSDTLFNNTNLILSEDSPFIVKEAYKAARTNLNFTLANKRGCKIVALTSCAQGDGKTTTCINLAITIAEAQNKVIVIDCDMRRSKIHKMLNIDRDIGLSNLLIGYTDLDNVIKRSPYGFDCLVAGPTPPNPSELLSSDVMGDLLETLSQHYDYILLDTPPVNVVSDALNFSRFIDGYVLTVRSGATTYPEVDHIKDQIEFSGSKILGFILNAVERSGSPYAKYQKYSYKYRYAKYTYYGYNESDI